MKNKYYYTTGFFIIAIIILIIWNFRSCNCSSLKKPIVKNPKEQLVSVKKEEDKSKKIIDSFENKTFRLEKSNKELLKKLESLRIKSKFYMEVYNKPSIKDSSSNEVVSSIIENSVSSDNLCDSIIENMSSQINNKDTVISAKEKMYAELKKSFLESVDNQEKLNSYSNYTYIINLLQITFPIIER